MAHAVYCRLYVIIFLLLVFSAERHSSQAYDSVANPGMRYSAILLVLHAMAAAMVMMLIDVGVKEGLVEMFVQSQVE